MSVEKLQQAIRRCKTPVALGLRADTAAIPKALLRQFNEMYGESPMATVEALRYIGCRVLEQAASVLPAVYLDAMSYLALGSAGLDVLSNLCSAAKSHGYYVIADSRAAEPQAWLCALPGVDAVTAVPYVGGECCRAGEEQAVFALVRTAGAQSGEVQNLMAGDRRLYLAVADQMARRGAGAVIETGFSLDIREVRKKQEKLFLLLTNCDGEAASHAFDDYGHGALVVDSTIQSAQDVKETAAQAVRAMKQWVTVL